jgi:hypothetical protein
MTRSALRHRPIESDAETTTITPVAQRASLLRPKHTGEEEDASSGKTSAVPRATTPHRARRKSSLRAHPLLLLGMGMIVMLVLWTLLTVAARWVSTTWDDLHYGRPRTFQIDMAVGHSDSPANPSHFIALNLNGRIEIIEFPGGDASKARIYIGPQLYDPGANLIPVTLSFVDVTGTHHPDMLVRFQDTLLVYINENRGFRPATSSEIQTVEHYLQQHSQ